IQTKSFASTKMPCSRPSHSAPLAGPPQLASSLPEASNSSTGGAALARCASGIDCGTCSTQMLSFRSTEMDVTSPRTQLLGIEGQEGSTLNSGACRPDCCARTAATPQSGTARAIAAHTDGHHRSVVLMGRNDTRKAKDSPTNGSGQRVERGSPR